MQKKNWMVCLRPNFLLIPCYSQELLCTFNLSTEKITKDPWYWVYFVRTVTLKNSWNLEEKICHSKSTNYTVSYCHQRSTKLGQLGGYFAVLRKLNPTAFSFHKRVTSEHIQRLKIWIIYLILLFRPLLLYD